VSRQVAVSKLHTARSDKIDAAANLSPLAGRGSNLFRLAVIPPPRKALQARRSITDC